MTLKFNCKHCGIEIVSKFLKVGEEIKCWSCDKTSTIPDNADGVSDSQIKEDHPPDYNEEPNSKYPAGQNNLNKFIKKISNKILSYIGIYSPKLANYFRENPVIFGLALLSIIILCLFVIFLIFKLISAIVGGVFDLINNIFKKRTIQAIVGFFVISIGFTLVHKIAESLASLLVFILIIGGTYAVMKSSYGWGDILLKSALIGGLIGIITLPLHTFIKDWLDED